MAFCFTVKQNPLEITFEAGSIKEGLAILESEGSALNEFFTTAKALAGDEAPATSAPSAEPGTGPAGKRHRRTKAEMEAARTAEAKAPAPAPVPPPAAPAPMPPVAGNGADPGPVPDFLKRTADAPVVQAPAPVAPPPAPPPAPPAPPAVDGIDRALCDKVVANLKERAKTAADGGKSLVDWLATANVISKTATFEDALAVVQFHKRDALLPIATALGVQ